jgi:hypothetical protein
VVPRLLCSTLDFRVPSQRHWAAGRATPCTTRYAIASEADFRDGAKRLSTINAKESMSPWGTAMGEQMPIAPGGNVLSWKDIAYIGGLLATFALGVWNTIQNHRNAQRTSFINTVTSERVKWIAHVRETISGFCGLTYHWSASSGLQGSPEARELLREIDLLRYLIRLQLNPNGKVEQEIEKLIEQIPKATDPRKVDELRNLLTELVTTTQRMLKEEWDKVKDESEQGRLVTK